MDARLKIKIEYSKCRINKHMRIKIIKIREKRKAQGRRSGVNNPTKN